MPASQFHACLPNNNSAALFPLIVHHTRCRVPFVYMTSNLYMQIKVKQLRRNFKINMHVSQSTYLSATLLSSISASICPCEMFLDHDTPEGDTRGRNRSSWMRKCLHFPASILIYQSQLACELYSAKACLMLGTKKLSCRKSCNAVGELLFAGGLENSGSWKSNGSYLHC